MAPATRSNYKKSMYSSVKLFLSKLKNDNNSINTCLNKLKSLLKCRRKQISYRNDFRLKQLEDVIEDAKNERKKIIHFFKYYTFCYNIASSDPLNDRLWFLQSDRCPVCLDILK